MSLPYLVNSGGCIISAVHPSAIACAAVLLTGAFALPAETPDRKLLSITGLTRELSALQGPSSAGLRNDPRVLGARVAKVRKTVGEFIVRQIEAYPAISNCDLQRQLTRSFGIWEDDCGGTSEPFSGVPRVLSGVWGSKSMRRIFVVTYAWFGFHGKGGSETFLESYVWERDRGVHRGAGMVATAFSGYLTQTEEVCWYPDPDRFWVLVSGMVGGASGRVLGGTAAVYEVGPDKITQLWSAQPGIGNVAAHAHRASVRWEIEYADVKRTYADLPHATLLDIYQIDYAKHTFRRLVHQPLD